METQYISNERSERYMRNRYKKEELELKKLILNCLSENKKINKKAFKRNYIDYNDAVTLSPTFRKYVDTMEAQTEFISNYVFQGKIAVVVVTNYLLGLVDNYKNDARIFELLGKYAIKTISFDEEAELITLNFAIVANQKFNLFLEMSKERNIGGINK